MDEEPVLFRHDMLDLPFSKYKLARAFRTFS